jgi:Putative prokaryotic signal transducing protein
MELVTVTTVGDAGLANLVSGVLEQAGIDAVIAGTGTEDVYPTPTVNPYHILVPEEDADRARDVLAQYDAMPDAVDDGE